MHKKRSAPGPVLVKILVHVEQFQSYMHVCYVVNYKAWPSCMHSRTCGLRSGVKHTGLFHCMHPCVSNHYYSTSCALRLGEFAVCINIFMIRLVTGHRICTMPRYTLRNGIYLAFTNIFIHAANSPSLKTQEVVTCRGAVEQICMLDARP